jgi:hypothetical protein
MIFRFSTIQGGAGVRSPIHSRRSWENRRILDDLGEILMVHYDRYGYKPWLVWKIMENSGGNWD